MSLHSFSFSGLGGLPFLRVFPCICSGGSEFGASVPTLLHPHITQYRLHQALVVSLKKAGGTGEVCRQSPERR